MTWWKRIWHRKQAEADLEKELSFHLDQHAADLTSHGENSTKARRQAVLALGGREADRLSQVNRSQSSKRSVLAARQH